MSSDAAELPAHKLVLAVRAQGLAAALSAGPRVYIPLSSAALSLWLDAVYDDATELGPACDAPLADELLAFAHAHDDPRLRALCEDRLARTARDVGEDPRGWGRLFHFPFGDGPAPPLTAAEEDARRRSVERLLALAERAAALRAAQLLDVVKWQLVRHAEHVVAVCQQRQRGAPLRQRLQRACRKDFVDCLAYEATKNRRVQRTPGGYGRSVPLSAYVEAGGQLRPGDPLPGSFASRRDRELGGAGAGARTPPKAVRDRELSGLVLRGFEERLGTSSVAPSRLVKLDLNMQPPYEVARATISSVSRAILPRMTETAFCVTAEESGRDFIVPTLANCAATSRRLKKPKCRRVRGSSSPRRTSATSVTLSSARRRTKLRRRCLSAANAATPRPPSARDLMRRRGFTDRCRRTRTRTRTMPTIDVVDRAGVIVYCRLKTVWRPRSGGVSSQNASRPARDGPAPATVSRKNDLSAGRGRLGSSEEHGEDSRVGQLRAWARYDAVATSLLCTRHCIWARSRFAWCGRWRPGGPRVQSTGCHNIVTVRPTTLPLVGITESAPRFVSFRFLNLIAGSL